LGTSDDVLCFEGTNLFGGIPMKSINTVKISSQNLTNRIINPKPLTKGFAPCPNWLLCRPEVSFGAKATYSRLVQFADKDGVAWPSQDVLAKELGIKTRQVKTYIQELVRFSLIAACLNGMPASNSYYFLYHPWIDGTTQQDGQSSAQQDGQSSAPYKNKEKNIEKNKEKNTHTKGKESVCVPNVEISAYNKEQWWEYAKAQKNVHSPEGLANELAKSKGNDHLMKKFLETKEQEKEKQDKKLQEQKQNDLKQEQDKQTLISSYLSQKEPLAPWQIQFLHAHGYFLSNQQVC
jgi:hypothetical protein